MPTKALKNDESSEESDNKQESMNKNNEEELSFISRKIQLMWRKRRGTMFKSRHFESGSKNNPKDRRLEDTTVCYECNKPGHFRS